MGDCSLGGLQKWFLSPSFPGRKGHARIPAGLFGLWRNWPVLWVRPLNLEGHSVSEPWLNSNGVDTGVASSSSSCISRYPS